ncbi:winged helix-turn-helix transcriptional regulator [Campylobacter hyointestinalis]|uniref:Helix-turn-helix transcriptional regulator n=1 Tax=Campylobacter hyointestinalis subsp. lawsonii TaxID=91353 RepID=A0AAV6EH30_CAMHY|nr:helix-turn-helix domain-containing protein [Campylobacter hyointestinalis]KAB0614421.1 helix-turn-helix transcriptional regulator [Campylobacter hyointestinalis subsp. lawsonii]QKF70177.1 transcriptional regulator, HxlR family [Campylobacter hyointestinalis subsp. lawsonii]RAZ28683.1 transcriptional regulator [Campylobacter hyointestinalis subsp. lawsonii]
MALKNEYHCTFELTLDLIAGKWKGMILWKLNQYGVLRNAELLREIPQITQKMLTQQLRELENDGLVQRKIYKQIPPKVEYSLSKCAKLLTPVLDAMQSWGEEYAKNHNIKVI